MALADNRIFTDQDGNQYEFDNSQNFMDDSGRIIIKMKKPIRKKGKQVVKQYLHQDKESGWDLAEHLGFDEGTVAFDEVRGWAYELPVELEVDMETGENHIISIDGKKVER